MQPSHTSFGRTARGRGYEAKTDTATLKLTVNRSVENEGM